MVRVVDLARDQLPAALNFSGGDGKVTVINGTLITVALSEASFLPGANGNSVVVDTSHVVYTHGAATDLVVGRSVGFRGQLDRAGVMQALFVDVEGAPSQNDLETHPTLRFADLAATVINLSGTTLSVTANPGEGTQGSTVTTYTVDISKAELRSWGTTCLTAGQHIRVKGALTGTSMIALEVEVAAACLNAPVTPTPPTPPASAASNPN